MVDWLSSMQQTFEYYIVNPDTWKDKERLHNIKRCSISRDSGASTLGSATIDIGDSIDECYVRIYMAAIQNGIKSKIPLGTFLVQTPALNFNGKSNTISLDVYTPLLELREKMPPFGYSILKNENVMAMAYKLVRNNLRAPVVKPTCSETLFYDFVADPSDTWIDFINDLISIAKYNLDMDEMGRILFAPIQETASLQPVWEYNDDNSSILYPSLNLDRDLYGIPNVVEVICSNGGGFYYSRIVNDDPNSPTSTTSRGREIVHRVTDPEMPGVPTKEQLDEYAETLLKKLSSLEYTITYTHGYCPVRINDCVRINYVRAGIKNVKAKVISQTIDCGTGCKVTETAVFTDKLWR